MKYLMPLAIDENVVVDEAEADPTAWDEEMTRRASRP